MGFPVAFKGISSTLLITSWITSLISFAVLCRMIWRKSEMKSGANLLLLNLTLVDVSFTSFCEPFVMKTILQDACNDAELLCLFFDSAFLMFCSCHLMTMLLIVVRRYCHRKRHSPGVIPSSCLDFSYQKIMYALPTLWMVSFCLCIPVIAGFFQIECNIEQLQCAFVSTIAFKILTAIYSTVFFLFPITLMFVFELISHSICCPGCQKNSDGILRNNFTGNRRHTDTVHDHYTNIIDAARRRSRKSQLKQQSSNVKKAPTQFLAWRFCGFDGCTRSPSTVFGLFVVTSLTWIPYFVMIMTKVDSDLDVCLNSSTVQNQGVPSASESTKFVTDSVPCTGNTRQVSIWIASLALLPYIGPLLRFIVYASKIPRFRAVLLFCLRFIASSLTALALCITPKLDRKASVGFYKNIVRRRIDPGTRYHSRHSRSADRKLKNNFSLRWARKSQDSSSKATSITSISEAILMDDSPENKVTSRKSAQFNFVTSWDAECHHSHRVNSHHDLGEVVKVETGNDEIVETTSRETDVTYITPAHSYDVTDKMEESEDDDNILFGVVT